MGLACVTRGTTKAGFRSIFLYFHYENTPMQHTATFHGCKKDNFWLNFFGYFHIFAQNIDCGYSLEPPH